MARTAAANDPFEIALEWLDEARQSEINDHNAIALATSDGTGLPDVRMVLLKGLDQGGFVFYTNQQSTKGLHLSQNPQAALVAHWKSLRRQVRARGPVHAVDAAMADAYFQSRALESRLGACASDQSRPLDSRETLERRVAAVRAEYGEAPPRPDHWGGYCLQPLEIELWSDGAHRLHDRFRYTRDSVDAAWSVERLYP